jgi:hypothetical protein
MSGSQAGKAAEHFDIHRTGATRAKHAPPARTKLLQPYTQYFLHSCSPSHPFLILANCGRSKIYFILYYFLKNIKGSTMNTAGTFIQSSRHACISFLVYCSYDHSPTCRHDQLRKRPAISPNQHPSGDTASFAHLAFILAEAVKQASFTRLDIGTKVSSHPALLYG